MITKYKDVDYKLQSSRKVLKKISSLYLIPIAIFFTLYFITEGGITLDYCLKGSALFILILFVNLFYIDWSITFENDILTVRKWIFKFNIPFENLINIEDKNYYVYKSRKRYYEIIIKYKKGNSIRHLRTTYFVKTPFFPIEYAKVDEVSEFVNIFVKQEGVNHDKTEINISDGNYRNIRSEREENELKDFLDKKKKAEEKIMWILLFAIIFVPVIFFTFVFIEVF